MGILPKKMWDEREAPQSKYLKAENFKLYGFDIDRNVRLTRDNAVKAGGEYIEVKQRDVARIYISRAVPLFFATAVWRENA